MSRPYERMELKKAGDVADVLKLGVGKLSVPQQPDNGQETPQSPSGLE